MLEIQQYSTIHTEEGYESQATVEDEIKIMSMAAWDQFSVKL